MPYSTLEHSVIALDTASAQLSQILEKNNQKLFWDNCPALLILCSTTHFIKVNKKWEELFGWSEKELYKSPFYDFMHPDDVVNAQEEVNAVCDGQKQTGIGFINKYKRKQGGYVELVWAAHTWHNNLTYASAIPLRVIEE